MAEKRTPPDEPGAGRRRKRTAPTIDLQATEITPPAEPPAAPELASEPAAAEDPSAEIPHPEPVSAAEPPPSPPDEERPRAAAPEAPPPPPPPPRAGYGMALAAGLAGAAIMAALIGALAYSGVLSFTASKPGNDGNAQVTALEQRVQTLQQSLQTLQSRPAPVVGPTVDPKTIDALNERVTRLQNDIAALPPGDKTLAERVGAAENAMRSLGVALTALNRRNDDLAVNAKQAQDNAEAAQKAVNDLRAGMQDVAKDASSAVAPAALDAVQQRVAALEQALKSAQDEVARSAAAARTARLAFAAAALRDAVVGGAPYPAALAQVKSLGGETKVLAPLDRFAQGGVPGRDAMAQELNGLMPEIVKASGVEQAPSGGFFERLQANAGRLVRVRPLDAPGGDAVPDVLARIEVAAAKADIDAALAALGKLPAAARKPAEAWIAKAEARRTALAAARALAAQTALGSQ